MKKLLIQLILITIILISCSNNNPNGVYIPTKKNLIKYIEFKDNGVCYVKDSFLGIKQPGTYRIDGKTLFLTDANGKIAPFTIINKSTLKCDVPFLNGIYKLKK